MNYEVASAAFSVLVSLFALFWALRLYNHCRMLRFENTRLRVENNRLYHLVVEAKIHSLFSLLLLKKYKA